MKEHKNSNLGITMKEHPNETFFFDNMTREGKQAVFNTATFFNRQASGLTTEQLKEDENLRRILKTLATY